MTSPSDEPRRVLHPRDLVCPRCGADVDRPCNFSGRVQEEVHCTERLLALNDTDLRVKPEPDEKPLAADPPEKRRPPPSCSVSAPDPSTARRSESRSPTLF